MTIMEKFISLKIKETALRWFLGFENWGGQVIEALRQVKEIDPRLSADGTEAVFELGDGGFTLYKDETGNWKFHL